MTKIINWGEINFMGNASKNVVFYTVHTQYVNLGDLVINKTLLRELRRHGRLIVNDQKAPDWFFKELEIAPEERASQYNVKFDHLILLFAFIRLFQRNKKTYLVLGPGHIYNEQKKLKLKPVLRSVLDLCLFRAVGIRVCRFGVSIGPFLPLAQVAERWRAKLMYFYSVRDSISEDYAHKLGIKKVEKFPDLAWLMEVKNLTNTQNQTRLENDYVIFSFREASHKLDNPTVYKENLYPVLDTIANLMCGKLAKQLVVSYQVEFDYKVCKEIRDRYREQHEVIFLEDKIDEQSMQNLYSHASLVFSNRLHVLIFAMTHGAIPIAVIDTEKHSKVAGIFSDAGLMNLVVDIQDTQFNVEALLEIIADTDRVKEKIKLLLNRNKSSAHTILNRVIDLLNRMWHQPYMNAFLKVKHC
jgi:polysaccharide pyruvyl transferase WcaK-like protein